MTLSIGDKVRIATRAAANLVGTCQGTLEQELESAGHAELVNDEQFCGLFDDRCFLCSLCGWWHDADEIGDSGPEFVCTECTGENEDYD